MNLWEDVRPWRDARRKDCLAWRHSMTAAERAELGRSVIARLRDEPLDLADRTVGFYWPIKGEIDLRDFITRLIRVGCRSALPVVVEKRRPVEFWAWTPESAMRLGDWRIPVPAERDLVTDATVLLVPLVGFDNGGFRLGYGAGYYDRTLAAASPRPITVGIGYERTRLDTIYPQPHDIPMDAIVTEEGFTWFERAGRTGPAAVAVEAAARRA